MIKNSQCLRNFLQALRKILQALRIFPKWVHEVVHFFGHSHRASGGKVEARNVSAKKLPVCFATLIISPKFARTTLKQPYKI